MRKQENALKPMKTRKTMSDLINANLDTIQSNVDWKGGQRAIADTIESEVETLLVESKGLETIKATSARSLADITVNDTAIDVKTSDEARAFKMPNMISIDRLKKDIIDKNKDLMYSFIIYNSKTKKIVNALVLNVFELNWDHLHIQNLGKGQLQIKNFNKFYSSLNQKSELTKEEWISRLQNEAVKFYEKLRNKTEERRNEWLEWNK